MILSLTFSKPDKNCQEILGKPYNKVRIWRCSPSLNKFKAEYEAEFFTQKQSFKKSMTEDEVLAFLKTHGGTTFKNVNEKTETEEITILSNRHGEIKELHKVLKPTDKGSVQPFQNFNTKTDGNRVKNYILKEGVSVPFLVELGVMTKEGKVISQKYDKFRQINRFLEYIDDILPQVQKLRNQENQISPDNPLRIADFGCGKSYLTFAVYYYLTELLKIPCEITGLDLKEDVIKNCSELAKKFGYEHLTFSVGDIAKFNWKYEPDIIITLHACDTATDYALEYAVRHNAKAILSVPCCQHEINLQLQKNKSLIPDTSAFASLTKYGIIRERIAALATDALRAEFLEQLNYNVQVLEFIDMSHTPKNLLIRAVKKQIDSEETKEAVNKSKANSKIRTDSLLKELHSTQTFIITP